MTTKAKVTVNPREDKKAKSSSPVESKRTTRKKTKSPEVEIQSPFKKPTKGTVSSLCVLKSLPICNPLFISDFTVHPSAPPKPPTMMFNGQENVPPPGENIRQLSASPQKPKSPSLYPVLSELQQKLSSVNHQPNQPSSPTPSTQQTPAVSPVAFKTVGSVDHKAS